MTDLPASGRDGPDRAAEVHQTPRPPRGLHSSPFADLRGGHWPVPWFQAESPLLTLGANCHSVDGSASKAGPNLFAAGDAFGRRELVDAVLKPSATIAPGTGTSWWKRNQEPNLCPHQLEQQILAFRMEQPAWDWSKRKARAGIVKRGGDRGNKCCQGDE